MKSQEDQEVAKKLFILRSDRTNAEVLSYVRQQINNAMSNGVANSYGLWTAILEAITK